MTTPHLENIEQLGNIAQQRGCQRPVDLSETDVEFLIELPDVDLKSIPAPQFFIGDRVIWQPLSDDTDSPEGGCIIGMKYWMPGLSEIPVLPENSESEWHYLIYLDSDSPSRSWIQSDWAAEKDLILQTSLSPSVATVSEEGKDFEP